MALDYKNQNQLLAALKSIHQQRGTHSYLLVGSPRAPLFEAANLMLMAHVCPHFPPCTTCLACQRIATQNYPGLLSFGRDERIKKEAIDQVVKTFSQTAIEVDAKQLYLLHDAHHATPQALNALLKFLEEPTPNTTAVLTTSNYSALLPTIISRCQLIRINELTTLSYQKVLEELGFSNIDAALVGILAPDLDTAKEMVATEAYLALKAALHGLLERFDNRHAAIYFLQTTVAAACPERHDLARFLLLLEHLIADLSNYHHGNCDILLKEWEALIAKNAIPDRDYLNIFRCLAQLSAQLTINTPTLLILEQLGDLLLR